MGNTFWVYITINCTQKFNNNSDSNRNTKLNRNTCKLKSYYLLLFSNNKWPENGFNFRELCFYSLVLKLSPPLHFSSTPPSFSCNTYISLFLFLSLFNQSLILPPLLTVFLHLTGQSSLWLKFPPSRLASKDCSQSLCQGEITQTWKHATLFCHHQQKIPV